METFRNDSGDDPEREEEFHSSEREKNTGIVANRSKRNRVALQYKHTSRDSEDSGAGGKENWVKGGKGMTTEGT